jgi:pimeloyl-ACP methyl ester carboxylesterase
MTRRRLRALWLAAALALASPAYPQTEVSAERVAEPVFGRNIMLYRAGPAGAEAVVLIHGLGQSGAQDWSKLVPALASRYEVFALDLPGFAQSDKANELYSPVNYARVIESVVAGRISRPFVLIGHSMGGAVAIAYASRYAKRVRGLIVVDAAGILHRAVYAQSLSRLVTDAPAGKAPLDAPWFDSFVQTVLTRMEPLPGAGRVFLHVPELRQQVLRGDPTAIAAYALVDHDFSHDLRAIRAPTLVIWGAEDKVAPLRSGQLSAALIPGARLAVLDRVAHTPMLQEPERFNALVADELAGRLQLAPYALPRGDPGARTATCNGTREQVFSGDYRELTLDGCADAQITNARIGRLTLRDSSVRLVNSHVYGGLQAMSSRIEVNAGVLGGDPPLILETSNVDAAGTRFETSGAIAHNRGRVYVTLSLSVSEAGVEGAATRSLHRIVRLSPGRRW